MKYIIFVRSILYPASYASFTFAFSTAGDFGGYIGLFLGGSVITMFEIVDLIFYNFVIKMTSRRQIGPAFIHRNKAAAAAAFGAGGGASATHPADVINVKPGQPPEKPVYVDFDSEKPPIPGLTIVSHA